MTQDLHQRRMESAAEPPFLDELADVWGARWGAWDEVGPLKRILVRAPGDELSIVRADAWDEEAQALVDPAGQWYWTDRRAPDLGKVREQHAGLVAALQGEGIDVVVYVLDAMGTGHVLGGATDRRPTHATTAGR